MHSSRLHAKSLVLVILAVLQILATLSAQTPSAAPVTIPRLINYAGVAKDSAGKPFSGTIGATFAIYEQQEGGAPLWLETQNIAVTGAGKFSVTLGSTTATGLPADLFSNGQARWLGIAFNGEGEQPRVSLLSVPYAMQAGDAQTLGGLPASAFVLATPMAVSSGTTGENSSAATSSSAAVLPPASSNVTTTGGTANTIPLFSTATNIQNSILTQTGTTALNVAGKLNLPATGAATSTAGKSSRPEDFVASSFSSSTSAAVSQTFQLQAEAAGNNTTAPSGTLNLLYGSGTSNPTETGLKISSKGIFTFATGQTFPGTGTITGVTTATGSGLSGGGTSGSLALTLTNACAKNQILQWSGTAWACAAMSGGGTITGVTAGTDLTGGGTSGNVTLNLNTAATDVRYAQLGASNSFTGNETVTGNLTSNGTVSGALGSFTGNSSNSVVNVIENATSGPGFGVASTSYNNNRGQAAVLGQELSLANAGVFGVEGFIFGPTGAGTYGQNNNPQSTLGSKSGVAAGVWGDAGSGGTAAVVGTADGVNSVVGFNNSPSWATIIGENQSTAGGSLAPAVVGFSFGKTGVGVVGSGPVHSNMFNTELSSPFQAYGVVGDSVGGTSVGGFTDSGLAISGFADSGSGVFGSSNSSYGVYGVSTTSAVGAQANGNGDAIDAYASGLGYGVSVGSVQGTAVSAYSGGEFTLMLSNSFGDLGYMLWAQGNPGTVCYMDNLGDSSCKGTSSSMVDLPGNRKALLYSMQSPENWFEDFGSAQLSNGSATVTLEARFAQAVNAGVDYHVFPVPNGDCKGLYVTQKTATGFVVKELGGGTSNVAFDYRIVARRKGYEAIRMEDVTDKMERVTALTKSSAQKRPTPPAAAELSRKDSKPGSPIPIPLAPRPLSPIRRNVPVASTTPVASTHTTH